MALCSAKTRRYAMDKQPSLKGSQSHPSRQTEDFQKRVTEEIVKMLHNELAVPASKDSDDVDFLNHLDDELDDSQLLTVEPPLTLSKIFSKLTALERLWMAGIVKQHGKQMVLTQWPMYEIQINYIRCLR